MIKQLYLTSSEIEDLDYLLKKIEKGEPFYALEVSKASYLLKRIRGYK